MAQWVDVEAEKSRSERVPMRDNPSCLPIKPQGGLYCITYTKNLISYTKLSMLKYYTYVTYDMLILNVSNIAITF